MSGQVQASVRSPSVVLFLAMFAAQSALLVLSPILEAVASDLGVTTAAAGQLRAVSGCVAGATALALGFGAARPALRDLLVWGLGLLALGSAASAAAPNFTVLAAAQAVVGLGLALVLTGGVAAAGEWASAGDRARVLSWALVGQPAAWIVGMPLAGFVGDRSWRLAWIVLPLVAAVLALIPALLRPRDSAGLRRQVSASVLRKPGVTPWALGELLANAGWAGTLVFAGALFVESYGVSAGTAGLLLAIAAAAYLPGNFLARRWVDRSALPLLIGLALVMGGNAVLLGTYRPSLVVSATVFAVLGFLGGGRTIAASAHGLDCVPDDKAATMSLRTAALQLGYLTGAAIGGAALAAGGYPALGAVLGLLLAGGAAPHVVTVIRRRRAAASGQGLRNTRSGRPSAGPKSQG